MPLTRLLLATLGALALLCSCAPTRPVQTEAQLLERRQRIDAATATDVTARLKAMLSAVRDRYEQERARGSKEPPTVNVLAISGGGDYGAFGAGFLKGWGAVKEPGFERPKFDVVLGVSTGALIAPFAFVGDDASYDKIVHLYCNPKPDWVVSRGLLYFLPSNVSFAEVPGLERDLRANVDMAMVRAIAAQSARGTMLAVNTTDLDNGGAYAWDLGAVARECVATENIEKVHQVMLASSGIPGAFPARQIDGGLYVDGGVTGNIIYGGRIKEKDFLPAVWKSLDPALPPLRIRYWVILNNWIETPPKTTQPTWVPVIGRSVDLAIRSATIVSLRHLYAMGEIVTLRGPDTMEVRLIAIPADWRPPVEGVFKEETMRSLAETGEKLGQSPTSWLNDLP